MVKSVSYNDIRAGGVKRVAWTTALLWFVGPASALCAPNPDLADSLRLSFPKADVVLLLDASGSMRQAFPAVRQAAIDFGKSLTEKEELHLRAFAGVPTAPIEGPGYSVRTQVSTDLPKDVILGGTDLGLAIEKGLDFLERPGANRLQAIFLLTDGRHEPPKGSPYSRDFERDPAWRRLRDRAHALCQQNVVSVYGFGLNQQTDIRLLLSIFPARNVEIAVQGAHGVNGFLAHVRERLRLDQMRRAIDEEVGSGKLELILKPATISGSDGGEALLTIRNAYGHLPVRVEELSLSAQAGSNTEVIATLRDAPRALILSPGKDATVRIRADLHADLPRWHIGRGFRAFSAKYDFVVRCSFPDRAEMEKLGAARTATSVSPVVMPVQLGAKYGIPLVVVGVVLLAVFAWAFRLRALRRRNLEQEQMRQEALTRMRTLKGRMTISNAAKGNESPQEVNLETYNAERVAIVVTPNDRIEVGSPGAIQQGTILGTISGSVVTDPNNREKPQYRLEPAPGRTLAVENRGRFESQSSVVLFDRLVFEFDATWRVRYANPDLPPYFVARASQ